MFITGSRSVAKVQKTRENPSAGDICMEKHELPADRYALVGHPVHHSRSPLIHQLFARQSGERVSYELIDAVSEQFEAAVHAFISAGGKGLNVTVPHKQAAYEMADELGPEAELAKAVNTLSFKNGAIRGDNTDGIGFMRDLTVNLKRNIEGQRVLLLGAGGAARGILGPMLAAAPAALCIANRNPARAEALQQEFGAGRTVNVCAFDALGELQPFGFVINATSAGLEGEQPPFPSSLVNAQTFCYDLAYSLKDTPFVSWAQRCGAGRVVQGWGMLVEQAAESYSIWRGRRPQTAAILSKLMR
jgi:shikimate dehydrogenase